jgi:hypothetical protein
VFGRRKREEEAAAEAAREAERRALFAKLAERPEHICPFLGLDGDRSGYIEGVSEDHRCFAFGEPATLSAEQQTRVCQERGYGNCPRYLRGVLVIPTEELEALRRPRAPIEETAPLPVPPPPPERRRRGGLIVGALVLLLLVGGGAGAWLLAGGSGLIGGASPTATISAAPSEGSSIAPSSVPSPIPTPDVSAAASVAPSASAPASGPATPTAEPTPTAGDTFAFYEVSVGPETYTLFSLDGAGDVDGTRQASFNGFSFARVEPVEGADSLVYWVTQEGGLTGWSYLWPDSGEFRIRAVFRSSAGERRSQYLDEDELTRMPEATPAP